MRQMSQYIKCNWVLILIIIVISIVGCTSQREEKEIVEVPSNSNISLVTTEHLLNNINFYPFFNTLFSLSEETFRTLNENRKITDNYYFKNLKEYRMAIKNNLGDYLSAETIQKLENQDVKLDFDFPKRVKINDYIVEAGGKVEEIEIKGVRALDNQLIYQVIVTATHSILPTSVFLNHYQWSEEAGYYIKKENSNKGTSNQESTYLYAQILEDEIKLKSGYEVYVVPKENTKTIAICKLKQMGDLEVGGANKWDIHNTSYLERVPYYSKPSEQEITLINKVVNTLLKAPPETYTYYEKIYGNNFKLIQQFWADLKLENEIVVEEETYKSAFDSRMNPYKDRIEKIKLENKPLEIVPSLYSTKLQPAFIVTIEATALDYFNKIQKVNYKYFIQIEKERVEAIQFLKMELYS